MRSIATLPRLIAILEDNRRIIVARSNNLDGVRKLASNAERLATRVDSRELHFSNLLLCVVEDHHVEGVVVSDAVLITLVLDDVLESSQYHV